ncbi:hypothetical protein SESBI_39861 [Sesbania bispinosa]|nr:hypothetical protein SESBI_39861 [Sesbania bispinosa]
MPISRYHIQSAYGLVDPELHRAADKDDSEALLEAVSMAGLVGFLRQLGDLAQFAAELFHDLHEEVMATAARGHNIISRVQQLEAEVPALEKAFLSQTHHSSFFTNGGIDWHPNLQSEQNLVTRGDLPRFIMDSYEECRGPPRLFLLDKFDVAGAGACLKRYTDPSFFKAESASCVTETVEVHREKRIRKVRKKGARPRNGETPELVPSHTKLHQLFLEERIENACSDPARLVKLKKKQLNGSAVEAKTGKSYMEKILEMPSPDHKMELELNPYSEMDGETNGYLMRVHEQISAGVTDEMSSNHRKLPDETELVDDELKKRKFSLDGYSSDDVISEVDDYMDALATIESELETDNECKPKKSLLNVQKVTDSSGEEERQMETQFSDSQSFGDSSISDEISSFEQDRNEEHNEVQAQLSDSQSTGTLCTSDDNSLFRRDRNEEHTQLQAQSSDSQSMGNSSPEIANVPSNQLPQMVESQKTCGEFVMLDDAHDQGKVISNSRPVSSGSCMTESGRILLSTDLGATAPMPLPSGTQSDETPSGPLELHLRLEDDEDKKCLAESITGVSDVLSPIKDDACTVVSYDNNSLNNLDVCDPDVHSKALLQVSNDLNLAHEVDDPIYLSMEADLNSCTKQLLDDRDLKSEDDMVAAQLNSEDLAEIEFLCPDQQSNFEEVPRIMPGDEISGSTCGLDPVDDDGHIKYPPSPDYIRQDNHIMVNDMFTIIVESDDQAASALPSFFIAENDASIVNCLASDFISSPSSNLLNLLEPSLGSSNSHQMEMESIEEEFTKISEELNAEKRENQLEPSSDITCSPMSSLTKLDESLSTLADLHEKEMEVNEAVARESLTELATHKVVDQPEIISTDVQLNLSRSVPCDPSDSGICNNIQHSSLEEMPPMPPLPPMQWRMSKVQDVSLVSQREEIEVSQVPFQPIQPVKPDDKSQFGLSTSEGETLLYHNPFFPIMAVESNKHHHSSGSSTGVSEHPFAIPLQFPVMVNEANGQHNHLVLERSQIQNPFLTLPVVSFGRPPHGCVVASEGERVLNLSPCPPALPAEYAVSRADSIFQQEKPIQSPSQLMEDISLEVKKDRPGEMHLVLPVECPVSGDPISPKGKPIQSPSQLMEETSLEVKTLEQSSINLERGQGDPSDSPVSPPSVEIVQPNHSLLPSEGKPALSLDTSAQTSEFGNEIPNRKPKKKLPPPQDPLIDAVAALDKSRLRKVTERVRSQIAPKVDERDSFLEQIRTKSFNLKPAAVTRPRIQGPKTNLRVAAILEKANAIRQALAGSDEDDDTDNWSDS